MQTLLSMTKKENYIYESPDGGKTVTSRKINDPDHKKEIVEGDYYDEIEWIRLQRTGGGAET